MKPTLGTYVDDDKPVIIDLARLLETRALIQANSGNGKSRALRCLFEQTAGKVQQLIIDHEGEYASLREKFDLVVCAASGADVAVHPRTAALLARRLLETEVSAVLDVSELKSHERHSFVRLFLESLVEAPKSLRHSVIVALDEAQIYAPEKGQGESEASAAVIDVATRGRKRGLCLVAATQRISMLHKAVAGECKNRLIGGTSLDVDVKRAAFDLGMTPKEALEVLRALEPGHFFAFGPAFHQLQPRKMVTGEVVTTHPKVGHRQMVAPPKPTAAILAMLPKLADLPKEAEAEARSIDDLRRELANARRELTQAKNAKPGPSDGDLYAATREGVDEGIRIATAAFKARIGYAATKVDDLARELRTLVSPLAEHEKPTTNPRAIKHAVTPATVVHTVPRAVPAAPLRVASNGATGFLTKAERLVLIALAQYPGGRTKVQIALLSGYAHNGGGFNNALGALRTRGLLEGDASRMAITAEGIAELGPFEALPSGQALLEYWLKQLSKAERSVLTALAAARPRALTKEEVATEAGYEPNGGGFNNALSRLRTLELINGRGELRASEDLFT